MCIRDRLFGVNEREAVVGRGGRGVAEHTEDDNDSPALPTTTPPAPTSTTAPQYNHQAVKAASAAGCGTGDGGFSISSHHHHHHRGVSPDAFESDIWGDASRPSSGLGLSASTPYHLGGSTRPQSSGGVSLVEGRMLTCNSIRIGQGRPPPPSTCLLYTSPSPRDS
eukprot:TRINITY_DN45600_c0_g1_i1.p1 TRINITY_DN45600_c0_g1~~TRINITY_DN45600_c0_g1_i1.p1  ORF type:complete len:166 (+),score=27.39 TRINITY_DN45600_c0_g1_i1:188-685(+)